MSKEAFVLLCLMGWCAAAVAMQSPATQELQKKLHVAIKHHKRAKKKAGRLGVFSKHRIPYIRINTPREKALRIKITYYDAETDRLEDKIKAASQTSGSGSSSSTSQSSSSSSRSS